MKRPNNTAPWSSISLSSSSSAHSSTSLNSFNSSSNNDSFLSYNLGLSLKRVKISTTPGELRLMKDIDLLMKQYNWNTINANDIHNTNKYDLVSPSNTLRMDRDPVDALRLRICIIHDDKLWIFLVQIPRMYPHTPPIIYRINCTNANPNGTMLSSSMNNPTLFSNDSMISLFSSSVPPPSPSSMEEDNLKQTCDLYPFPHTNNIIQQQLNSTVQISTKIIISNNNQPNTKQYSNQDNLTTCNNNTVSYHGWTPISTLYDLITWLDTIAINIIITCQEERFDTKLFSSLKKEKYNILFPLNRFNVGYNTTNSNTSTLPSVKRRNNIISMDLE